MLPPAVTFILVPGSRMLGVSVIWAVSCLITMTLLLLMPFSGKKEAHFLVLTIGIIIIADLLVRCGLQNSYPFLCSMSSSFVLRKERPDHVQGLQQGLKPGMSLEVLCLRGTWVTNRLFQNSRKKQKWDLMPH